MADEKQKLNNSLQCHVCCEEYKVNDRIWQCKSGHSVCTSCRRHINECPFCKAPYEGTRNYAVEEIVRELNEKSDDEDGGNNSLSQPSAPDQEDGSAKKLSTKPSAPAIDYTVPSVDPNTFRSQATRHYASSSQSRTPQNYSNDTTYISDEFSDMVVVNAPTVSQQEQHFENVWVDCHSYRMPSNMIVGGRDHGNTPLYIGRAKHRRDLLPGKVHPKYKQCYVAWDGGEHEKSDFQVLTNVSGTWLPNYGRTIPKEAFPGGYTEDGETLYIGRAHVGGTLAIGKVHPSHGCCYVSYAGREHGTRNYEIFVLCPT